MKSYLHLPNNRINSPKLFRDILHTLQRIDPRYYYDENAENNFETLYRKVPPPTRTCEKSTALKLPATHTPIRSSAYMPHRPLYFTPSVYRSESILAFFYFAERDCILFEAMIDIASWDPYITRGGNQHSL